MILCPRDDPRVVAFFLRGSRALAARRSSGLAFSRAVVFGHGSGADDTSVAEIMFFFSLGS